MIRIICPECKNAYLQKAEADLVCPGCNKKFSESEEYFLSGAQYYHEGDFVAASDCLMKYIVKNGAEPRAIFYKALCDAQNLDEDTLTLKDLYVKILESFLELSDDDFVRYLILANDEVLKTEKALTQLHLDLFVDADAEKIKKEVSAIIRIQDEAKIYRNKLNEFANAYNERATDKISVKLSSCFFVDPIAASEVGDRKFEKIVESINSHTVFTGILSNDIKNLEIYYRCVVMFFEKNRRKYEFLISSAEKFSMIAKLLEDGRYSTIKGIPTICEKLKSAAYDFFQESLHDHDDEFEQQTETVVVLEAPTVEIPVENDDAPAEAQEKEAESKEFEDVYSSTIEESPEEVESDAETQDVYSFSDEDNAEDNAEVAAEADVAEADVAEEASEADVAEAVEKATEENTDTASEENAEDISEDTDDSEPSDDTQAETESAEEILPETESLNVGESDAVIELDEEIAEAVPAEESIAPEEAVRAEENNVPETAETEDRSEDAEATDSQDSADVSKDAVPESKEPETTLLKTIAQSGNLIKDNQVQTAETTDEGDQKNRRKHKKSLAPIIVVLVIVFAIAGLIAVKFVPSMLKESNYEKAGALLKEKNFSEAAVLYEKLGDYEDSEDKYLLARYSLANALEAEKKYDEAKEIYISLGNYEDSAGKINSCTYNSALLCLEQGKYDEAIAVFNTLDGYADSHSMIDECNYQKAVKLTEAGDYEKAIEILEALSKHPQSENALLEAKYGYVSKNFKAENETTLSYLKDLAQAKYKDSADLRNKLLGTSTVVGEGISTCINNSETDFTENLQEVDSSKPFYFHVTVTNPELYTKKLTLEYETSAGYGFPEKSFVLTENENTYTLTYPSDPGANYSITFSVLADDSSTLISQKVVLK